MEIFPILINYFPFHFFFFTCSLCAATYLDPTQNLIRENCLWVKCNLVFSLIKKRKQHGDVAWKVFINPVHSETVQSFSFAPGKKQNEDVAKHKFGHNAKAAHTHINTHTHSLYSVSGPPDLKSRPWSLLWSRSLQLLSSTSADSWFFPCIPSQTFPSSPFSLRDGWLAHRDESHEERLGPAFSQARGAVGLPASGGGLGNGQLVEVLQGLGHLLWADVVNGMSGSLWGGTMGELPYRKSHLSVSFPPPKPTPKGVQILCHCTEIGSSGICAHSCCF